MEKKMTVNEKEYEILKLLGKGKGGKHRAWVHRASGRDNAHLYFGEKICTSG